MGKKFDHIAYVSLHPPRTASERRTIPVYQIPDLSIVVKEGRKKHNLTQTELAQRTGLTIAEISRLESGNILKPSLKVLKALSPYVGISYSDLLFYAGYSGNTDEPEYYDLAGNPISCDTIINDIYSVDANLLSLLKDINCFTSYEDRELLKLLLQLMKVTYRKDDMATSDKEIFMATKNFLLVQLKELLNKLSHNNV